jgi:hypothetical protein
MSGRQQLVLAVLIVLAGALAGYLLAIAAGASL